jgi:hypothetical protein
LNLKHFTGSFERFEILKQYFKIEEMLKAKQKLVKNMIEKSKNELKTSKDKVNYY